MIMLYIEFYIIFMYIMYNFIVHLILSFKCKVNDKKEKKKKSKKNVIICQNMKAAKAA